MKNLIIKDILSVIKVSDISLISIGLLRSLNDACVNAINSGNYSDEKAIDIINECIKLTDEEIGKRGNGKYNKKKDDVAERVLSLLTFDYEILVAGMIECGNHRSIANNQLVEMKCIILSVNVAMNGLCEDFALLDLIFINKELERRRSVGEYDDNSIKYERPEFHGLVNGKLTPSPEGSPYAIHVCDKSGSPKYTVETTAFNEMYAKSLSIIKHNLILQLSLYPELKNSHVVNTVIINLDKELNRIKDIWPNKE